MQSEDLVQTAPLNPTGFIPLNLIKEKKKKEINYLYYSNINTIKEIL